MGLHSVAALFGGLALFLFGMHLLSSGLERHAGGRLEHTLKRLTADPIRGLLAGACITAAMQSSSALTVMLVGLVNAGVLTLSGSVSLIMGSNIGTTLTAWFLSLFGTKPDHFLLFLLQPEQLCPLLAVPGVLLFLSKHPKKRTLGLTLLGAAMLMCGMRIMQTAMSPLAKLPAFSALLTRFQNPLLGLLAGTAFTGIIQSSAASVGILQALARTGQITYGVAIPIILGQNIGTCITAFLASIGARKNARQVAAIHVSFNLIGAALCLMGFYGLNALFHFSIVNQAISPVSVAGIHTLFNLVATALLFPHRDLLVHLAQILVPDQPIPQKHIS